MSFPWETPQLIAHLRASHLLVVDEYDYAKRIICLDDTDAHTAEGLYFQDTTRASSPPITLNLAGHVELALEPDKLRRRLQARKRKSVRALRHRSKELADLADRKEGQDKPTLLSLTLSESPEDSESPENTLSYSKTIRGKPKRAIVKFFQKNDDSESDSSDGGRPNLELIEEYEEELDLGTLKSDVTMKAPVPEADEDSEHSSLGSVDPDETASLSDTDHDLLDSAFTDIETDSVLDLLSLFETYDTYNSKKKKLKKSFDSLKTPLSAKLLSPNRFLSSTFTKSSLDLKKSLVFGGKKNMLFEKLRVQTPPHSTSNLSQMIQSRLRSANVNPLQYYAFAAGGDGRPTKVNVFVPPKTTPDIRDLEINDNVSVADCIGYMLLSLSKLDTQTLDVSWLNPNHWRLELVDEDGENFGLFGILDRTRLLSSYNNPHDLAVCRVTNPSEIASNERASPLPQEFKASLESFEERTNKFNSIIEQDRTVQISGIVTDTVTVLDHTTLDAVLHDVCSQHNLDPAKYKLMSTSFDAKRSVALDTLVLQLTDLRLEMAPDLGRVRDSTGAESYFAGGITPSLFSMGGITPPKGHRPSASISSRQLDKPRPTSDPKNTDSTQYLEEIINGKNQLPSTLNEIYLKWKVWRKKPPILNKIEKQLIIDGDYIHLAPTEDITWKTNPLDNPFASTNNSSHHHHLHHYNYSSYYNKSMMKTSSFHITQITKLKQYKASKNPNHFKIVIKKDSNKDSVQKKYDLEAVSVAECEDIINNIRHVLQVYNMSNLT